MDTGSTDGTRTIISEYGPVTELPFEDFVTTKNKALALATGEYILFMDADERLLAARKRWGRGGSAARTTRSVGRIIDGPSSDQVSRNMTGSEWRSSPGKLGGQFTGRGCMRSSAGPAGEAAA